MEHDLLTWEERGQLWLRLGIRLVCVIAALLLLIFALPPLLSLFLPFVLGLIVAWVLNPLVRWLHRKLSVSRKILSLILILLAFCILGGALFGLVWAAVRELRTLFENWDAVTGTLLGLLDRVNEWLRSLERFLPEGSSLHGDQLVQSVAGWLQGVDSSRWLASLTDRVPDAVSAVTNFAIAAVVFLMACYFITSDYPRLRFLITDRVPADARELCGKVRTIFMEAFGGYLRSQLILTLGVFLILAIGFTVTRQSYGLVLAGVLAIMDFIPIIGSGTVMVPWIAVDLISGNYRHAIGFAVIWGLVAVFRRVAEPKILGDQTGLSPILSLVGIYAGMRLAGVAGMIVGPLLILVCINLGKLGVFRPAAGDVRMAAADVRAILRGGRGGDAG